MPRYILDGEIDIEPLILIRNILKRVLQEEEHSEILEMGAVQAFEVGYELSWKGGAGRLYWSRRTPSNRGLLGEVSPGKALLWPVVSRMNFPCVCFS